MTRIKLKHIDRFKDRHGRVRYYYRRGKGSRIMLPGAPGTSEFLAAYQAAQEGQVSERQQKLRGEPRTFDRLAQDYFTSSEYLRLATSTQKTYRLVIERLIVDEGIGHRLVREMTRDHLRKIIARRAQTPGAANSVLQKLKVLIHFAMDNGWRDDDPTLRLKKFPGGEFHTWTEDEIAQYERRWPLGTTQRLALALLLYTGQRRSDVVKMHASDVADGAIQVVPLKTRRSTGKRLWIPIHPALAEALAIHQVRDGTLLKTQQGAPFSANGFGNYMADRIQDAGLPERCVTHGLRKASARRLAEAGCSANEIAAITGHATLQEVTRYTKAAEQRKLAAAAMRRLTRQTGDAEAIAYKKSQTSIASLGIRTKNLSPSMGGESGWWSRGESNP
jgi:integrase